MRVGLVGLAGSGKTTIFNALTGLSADTGFGGKNKTNLGMIKVPDPRVDFLAAIYQPKKTTYAEIGFVDVAGPESASETGLDKGLVNEMRSCEALVHVVRAFENPGLTRPPDVLRDLVDFESEMILTDLIQIDTRIDKLRKEGAKSRERDVLELLHDHLDAGHPLRAKDLSGYEDVNIGGFHFLSSKPCIVLVNQPDQALDPASEVVAAAQERGLTFFTMAGRAEAEIAELPVEDQAAFLEDLGLQGASRDRFIKIAYDRLDLISYLTSGDDDCHAWTIERGTNAQGAAGKVHTDLERGFIRAEIVSFADLEKHGSEAKCRSAGVLRVVGKGHVVEDGDIIHFLFNV